MGRAEVSGEQSSFSKFVELAEKDRTNIVTAFLIIFIISFARSLIESWVFEAPSESLYSYANDIVFFFAMFVLGGMIISVFSKTKIRKTFNVILMFWWIILLPPLIDKFIFGRSGYGQGYYYFTLSDISSDFFNVLFDFGGNLEKMGIGETVQFSLFIILTVVYIAYKTRSIYRVIYPIFVFPLFFIAVTAMPLIIAISNGEAVLFGTFHFPLSLHYYPGMTQETANFLGIQQWLLSIASYYLVLFFLGTALITYVKNRPLFTSFLKTIRPARMIHGMTMVLVGVLVGGILEIFYPLHWPYIFLGMVSIACSWQFTTMWNDIYDITIDKISHDSRPLVSGAMEINQYKQISFIFAIIAACSSFLLGPIPFILIILCLLFGYAYSAPPFRLRERIGSTMVIGTGSLLAYLVGVFTPSFWLVRTHGWIMNTEGILVPDPLTYSTVYYGVPHPITWTIMAVGLIIWVALSLAPIISSYEDTEGDAESNVKSIHTVYGKPTGKKIILIIIPVLFLFPLLLFNSMLDILLFMVFSLLGVLSFRELESAKPIFLFYFIEIIYCMLRFSGMGA